MTDQSQDERGGLWSASSAERVHFCPGSVPLINSVPLGQREQLPDEARDSGTRIHAALETSDDSALDMTEAEIKEQLKKLEMQAFQQWAADVNSADSQFQNSNESPTIIREERMWIRDAELDNITSAKLDVAYHIGQHGLALDFKSGFKPTTAASRNFQAKVQAVALWQETGATKIRVAIAQHRFTSMLTQADYDEAALGHAYLEILQDDWRSKQPDAPRVPGYWCDYCPVKSHCPEAAIYTLMPMECARRANTNVPMMSSAVANAVDRMTLRDLAFIENRRTIAEKVFAEVRARLKRLDADTLALLGFKLRPGNAQMEVKDAGAIIEWLEKEGVLKPEEVLPLFKLNHGALEELVAGRLMTMRNLPSQKAALEFLRKTIQEKNWIDYQASRTESVLKSI